MRALPTFVKDTNHALNLVRNFRFRGENRLLFTMDIKGLYTNIPNEYGLNALKYFLEKRNVQNPPTHTFLRLAELVLTKNCFKFGDNYYSQTGGTMIGTPFGQGRRKLKSLKHMMVLFLSFTKGILMIFWVQLQCLEKIWIDL